MSNLEPQNHTERDIRNLLPGYVLGILEPDELLIVDDYLAAHPDLWSEVRSLEQTAGQLAYSAPSATVSVRAKERILSRVTSDAKLQMTSQAALSPLDSHPPTTEASDTPTQRESAHPRRRSSRAPGDASAPSQTNWLDKWTNWWRNALAWKIYGLATSAALVLLALIFNPVQEQLSIEREKNSQLAATVENLDDLVAELRTESEELLATAVSLQADNEQILNDLALNQAELDRIAAQNEELQTIIDEQTQQLQSQQSFLTFVPTLNQSVDLDGTDVSPNASGSLLIGQDEAYLVLSALSILGPDQTYQLWLIPADGDPVDSGLIDLDSSESSIVAVDLALDVADFDVVGLSIEPAGGSASPTVENIVLLGPQT